MRKSPPRGLPAERASLAAEGHYRDSADSCNGRQSSGGSRQSSGGSLTWRFSSGGCGPQCLFDILRGASQDAVTFGPYEGAHTIRTLDGAVKGWCDHRGLYDLRYELCQLPQRAGFKAMTLPDLACSPSGKRTSSTFSASSASVNGFLSTRCSDGSSFVPPT
jgi:hypothetical protein